MKLVNWLKSKVNSLLVKLGLKAAPVCRKKTCCKKK